MTVKCKHHESHITNTIGTVPNGQTQTMGAYKCTSSLTDNNIRSALCFPIKVIIMLYRTSDAEAMKTIIKRTRHMQQENPRRPYDHYMRLE